MMKHIQGQRMNKKIKLITFDLDDTLWDNMPTIRKAEIDTRKWIEDKVGRIEWGDFDDFLNLREELIKEDESIAWDISKLRKEIFRKKLIHIEPESYRNELVDKPSEIFIKKPISVKVKYFDILLLQRYLLVLSKIWNTSHSNNITRLYITLNVNIIICNIKWLYHYFF